MPPRKKTAGPPPLTDDDVAAFKARLGAGERPRVVVRAASAAVPAGTRGNVIRLGDPREGEFIVVRLGRDEVPFAPSELSLPTRARSAATAAAAPAARKSSRPAKAAAASKSGAGSKPSSAAAGSGTRSAARPAATSTPASAKPAAARPAGAAAGSAPAAARSSRRSAGSPARATGPTERARRTRSSRRASPPLTVTLRFTDDQWTVEAQRGARRIARPSAVRPGAVKAFADLVDDPDVRAAMSETVESSRAVVAQRAQELRAELEAAEAALREYEARRR